MRVTEGRKCGIGCESSNLFPYGENLLYFALRKVPCDTCQHPVEPLNSPGAKWMQSGKR